MSPIRLLLRRLKLWYQCKRFLGVTPKKLRFHYAEFCLAVQSEPIEIADRLYLFGDQCTNVRLLEDVSTDPDEVDLKQRLALNAGTYTSKLGEKTLTGLSIQYMTEMDTEGKTLWLQVYRSDPPWFLLGSWTTLLRRAVKANVRAHVTPLPISRLGGFSA